MSREARRNPESARWRASLAALPKTGPLADLKQHTIIFVPHVRAKHGKWRLRKWRLSTLQVALILGSLAFLTLGGVVATVSYFNSTIDREQLVQLKAENASLREVNQGFEASIGARPTPAACLALAELFEQQLQQPDKAAEYYQQGLKLSLETGH